MCFEVGPILLENGKHFSSSASLINAKAMIMGGVHKGEGDHESFFEGAVVVLEIVFAGGFDLCVVGVEVDEFGEVGINAGEHFEFVPEGGAVLFFAIVVADADVAGGEDFQVG